MSELEERLERRYNTLAEQLVTHPDFPDDQCERIGELMADAFAPIMVISHHMSPKAGTERREAHGHRDYARKELKRLFKKYLDEEP